jgi:uncharacterized protein YjbI with pentapeptide repeats
MRTFRTLSLLYGLVLFNFSCEEKPEEIKINDHAFLDALIEQGVDINADGIISPAEAQTISKLDLNGKGIIDMTGIESFINLDSLYCESNEFTWINLSECRKLRVLYCSHGRLRTLDVSNNPLLVDLACERNVDLRQLDVSYHPQLFYLNCQYCGLTSLDITGAVSLEILMSEMNRITSIDFSTNPKLRYLFFAFCDLESVDLSGLAELNWAYFQGNQLQSATLGSHPDLENLGLGMNQLTEVELSGCTALRVLGLGTNELTSLDVSSCPDIESLNFTSNHISEIDLSNQIEIHSLRCSDNQLTSLTVSNMPELIQLECGLNQLTILDLSSNSNLGLGLNEGHGCFLEIGDMPTLEEVCVWTDPFPPDGFFLCMNGSPNVNFTTNCTTTK